MKKLFPALLLGLASRPALAAPLPSITPPTVPATLEVAGLHLTLDANARQLVQAKVNSLCRHTASLQARVALAEAAFPLIDQVLAEEGVPADFRYLVLQESALQGNAESNHGAVGYWQLKRETALSLGLTVNGTIDERRHLTASTRAAARFLTRNNATLHNWANALLSYQTGLG
ncbi:MAG: lytic transglycosylase domain-containing protein, partial [Hymenobacter sp.]